MKKFSLINLSYMTIQILSFSQEDNVMIMNVVLNGFFIETNLNVFRPKNIFSLTNYEFMDNQIIIPFLFICSCKPKEFFLLEKQELIKPIHTSD